MKPGEPERRRGFKVRDPDSRPVACRLGAEARKPDGGPSSTTIHSVGGRFLQVRQRHDIHVFGDVDCRILGVFFETAMDKALNGCSSVVAGRTMPRLRPHDSFIR
jgi:hypothetical protein